MQRLKPAVLPLQFKQPEGAPDRQGQQFWLKRFGEKVVRAQSNGPQGIGLVVLTGEHNHLDIRIHSQNLLQQFETFRHRVSVRGQPQIHGDDCWRMATKLHQRTFPVVGCYRLELIQ